MNTIPSHRAYWGRRRAADLPPDIIAGWEDDQFFLDTRRIYLLGPINDDVAAYAVQRMQRLSQTPSPVFIYISSDGGYVDAGYSIIDQMLMMPGPVITIVSGRAYSMGSIIAAYGTPGRRYVTPHASVMLHPISYGLYEDYAEIQHKAEQFNRESYDRFLESLSKRIKGSTKTKLRRDIDKGLWLNPKQAIAFGLVDGIWTGRMEAEINKLAGSDKKSGSRTRLAQIAAVLRVLSEGIDNGEEIAVEKTP